MIDRHLNVQLLDLKIIERGWKFVEAAERLDIDKKTLRRIYDRKNVNNEIILKVSKALDIPLEQLVVWPAANGKAA